MLTIRGILHARDLTEDSSVPDIVDALYSAGYDANEAEDAALRYVAEAKAPSDDRTSPAPGVYVASGWGHYGTARALQVSREMGWAPSDAAVVDAQVLTYLSDAEIGLTREEAQEARELGLLPHIDTLDETSDVFEDLVGMLDDAETWLNERPPSPGDCPCTFWGWKDGDWGLMSSDQFDDYDHAAGCHMTD
jgi:hypothetical protein